MIAACFQSSAETADARADRDRPDDASAHPAPYRGHLDSPALQAEALCGQFRISRSQLYRLFEPLGGVAHYIQEQRVTRACAELCNPAHDHRRIYEIAFALGFRARRISAGLPLDLRASPSDVRGRAQATRVDTRRPEPADIANGGYEEWVRQLK